MSDLQTRIWKLARFLASMAASSSEEAIRLRGLRMHSGASYQQGYADAMRAAARELALEIPEEVTRA